VAANQEKNAIEQVMQVADQKTWWEKICHLEKGLIEKARLAGERVRLDE
jgi:hypothetical protein